MSIHKNIFVLTFFTLLINTNFYHSNPELGGFHLGRFSDEQLTQRATKMKNELIVNWVSPTHCTGENAQDIFKDVYKDSYKKFELGSTISF